MRHSGCMSQLSLAGDLTLGHVMDAAGLSAEDVVVIRHTYNAGGLVEGQTPPAAVLRYTQRQSVSWNVGVSARTWLCFFADGQRRSRYYGAFTNRGEVAERRTDELKYFDLEATDELSSLRDRLVIEWSLDAVNWSKKGSQASSFPVVEIADRHEEVFPGFERLRLPYWKLVEVMTESRYANWRSALGSVQGIYVIADTSNGKLYVGKADGRERILGRWRQYAADGHGGNVALKEISDSAPDHPHNFVFSVLRVYDPSVPLKVVNEGEAHFKSALQSRTPLGYNRN